MPRSQRERFNIVSESADGMGFGERLVAEDYDVRMWIRDQEAKSIGDRIVEKVGDIEDLIVDASPDRDIFIFDVTGNGVIADYLGQNGFSVLGGSIIADRLERDRAFGSSVMQRCNLDVPETHSFDSFEEASAFAEKKNGQRWVYKPSKQLGDLSMSYVSADAEDLIGMLKSVSEDVDLVEPQFELQEYLEGVALSTEFWFQHGDWIEPLTNHTLERKQLMDGNLGPAEGCMGNITWFCEGCPVCGELQAGIAAWAAKQRYHGMLDLNAIINRRGIYGLEWTPRFGYDATPTLLWELIDGGVGRFLADMAAGSIGRLSLRDGYAGCVRVSIPSWTTDKNTAEEGIPIRGIDEKVLRNNVYWYNVKRDSASQELVTSGNYGIIALFTNHSSNYSLALQKPLAWAEEMKLKDKQYRTDLQKQFNEDFKSLEEAGVMPHASAVHQ